MSALNNPRTMALFVWAMCPLAACSFHDEGAGDKCGNTVGRYQDGFKLGSSAAFKEAFLKHTPGIGCPIDNRNSGNVYVHEYSGVDVQDYEQKDKGKSLSLDGKSALLYNPGLGQAFLVTDSFASAFWCLSIDDKSHLLGPPTDERHMEAGMVRQSFSEGWLTLDPGSSQIPTVHLTTSRAAARLPSACQGKAQLASPVDGRNQVCARPVDLARATPTNNCSAAIPSCTLDANGALVMEYQAGCPVGFQAGCEKEGDIAFRGCQFAWHQDVSAFDPEAGHGGVFEIFLCVEGPVDGAINFWYQDGRCGQQRYFLPLLDGKGTPAGCRRIYVAPEDVRGEKAAELPYCTAWDSAKNACRPSKADLPDAALPDAAAETRDGAPLPDGGDGESCQARPDFSDATFTIMNEWCDPQKSSTPDAGTTRITIRSVVYHPAGCVCDVDDDCAVGSSCQHVTWPEAACCACSRCPGICR